MAPSSTWEVGPPLDLARNCYHGGERNQREIIWEILPSLGWSPTGKFNGNCWNCEHALMSPIQYAERKKGHGGAIDTLV